MSVPNKCDVKMDSETKKVMSRQEYWRYIPSDVEEMVCKMASEFSIRPIPNQTMKLVSNSMNASFVIYVSESKEMRFMKIGRAHV